MEKFPFTNEWILFNTNYFLMKFYTSDQRDMSLILLSLLRIKRLLSL